MSINPCTINNVKVYPYHSKHDLVMDAYNYNKMLFSANGEILSNQNNDFKAILNQGIAFPDGVGAVLALRKKGVKDAIKIPGCELWLEIIKYGYKSKTFYLVGGKDEVIKRTVEKLKIDFEGIRILNYRNGFITSKKDRNTLIEDVISKKPDVVFIAMGSPKQELLMNDMQKKHSAIYMGLGGSFDVYTGNVKRAPKIFIKLGLEWFYRLLKQPSRIKRQIPLMKFIYNLYMGKM